MSRLRRALVPYGVVLERRGAGYRIELGEAVLDSQVFARLVEGAAQASTAGDDTRAAALAAEALGLWRGPVLSGISLHLNGRAEADRLDELRSRALELRVDADLALGRHAELVGELRPLVEESPFRERFVAQLMVALYRSGRHAEALEAYERTRRALDEDLGLQPSAELQRLAGQIVRQEPRLRVPAPTAGPAEDRPTTRRRKGGAAVIVIVGALTALAIGVTLGVTVLTDARSPKAGRPARVALIRMWDPGGIGSGQEAGWKPFVDGLLAAEREHNVETEIVDLFPRRPPAGGYEPGSKEDVERLSARLGSGRFDLVVWPEGLTGPHFFAVVSRYPHTRFVFIDYCCATDPGLDGAPNVTTIALRAEQAAHLAGYLGGLMEARRPLLKGRQHMVSSITGDADYPQEAAWQRGFAAGARRALPGVVIRADYSHDYDNPETCEMIANRQIDAGSGVVFAASGECGRGAFSAAAVRGVWAIPADEDFSYLGPHILASATKHFDSLVERSVSWYLERRLPPGEDVELGLADDAVALVGISPKVPLGIRSKVAQEAARLKARDPSRKS